MCGKNETRSREILRLQQDTRKARVFSMTPWKFQEGVEQSGQSSNSGTTMRNTYEQRTPGPECIRKLYYVSLDRLENSGWYWGQLSRNDAVLRLKSADVGTFLLRDSSDSRYLYALSVRTKSRILNIRVSFSQGKFMFECYATEPWETPRFDCVLKLIAYYVGVSKRKDDRAVCARTHDLGENSVLTLEKPLFRNVPTLQHFARRVINRTLTAEKQLELNLRGPVESFMREYPFGI